MKRLASMLLMMTMLLGVAFTATGCKGDPATRKKKFLEMGIKSYNKGDYKAASLSFRKALQEDNKFPEAYYRLGLTSMKVGNLGDAVGNLQRAFTLDNNNSDAGAKLAEIFIYALASDPKKARAYTQEIQDVSEKLLKKDPKSFDGLRLQAFLLAQDGKRDEAIEKYKAANEVKPDEQEVLMPWAFTLLQEHKDQEAEVLLKRLLSKHKDSVNAYDVLYTLYSRDKRLDEAEKILKAKADALPEKLEYRVQLAGHYFVNQKRAEMEKELAQVSSTGKDGAGQLWVGDFFLNLKEYDRAQKEYETGLAGGGPKKINFQLRLVNLYSTQAKYKEANELIDKVVKENPQNSDATGMRASLGVSSGEMPRIEAAINDLQALVKKNPENPVTHYELGRAYLAKAQKTNKVDQVDLGRVELETTVKLRPDFVPAKMILAELQLSKGEFGKAIVTAGEILDANPANLQAHLIRAVSWARQREFAKARASLEGILKASPSQIDAQYYLADVLRMEGKYKEAETMFQQFRKAAPSDARGWSGLAQTYRDAKRYKDAQTFLLEEVSKDPKKEGIRLKLGEMYVEDKMYDQALEQFRILQKAHPESSDINAYIGDTLRKKGDLNAAIDVFQKAVQLNPQSPGPMVNLAMCLEDVGRPGEARALYEKIITIEPLNYIALNNLAFLKAEEGTDLDGAMTMAQKARQQAPQIDTISDTLGWIFIKKNLSDEAIRIYNDLTTRDPNNAMYRYHLAQALLQKGDKVKARQQCQDALNRIKTKPDAVYEKKLKELMGKLG